MSEGKQISRKEIAKRIADVERVTSQISWKNNDCLPRAVAFTHGILPDSHELGLHARGFVHQAIKASESLAERNGEVAETNNFAVENSEETKKKVSQNLNNADKAWLFYGNSFTSHALGILKLDDDEFLVANLGNETPYQTMNSSQITDQLMERAKLTELAVCVIGFRKK